jgi:hypothetical protein
MGKDHEFLAGELRPDAMGSRGWPMPGPVVWWHSRSQNLDRDALSSTAAGGACFFDRW